MITGCPTHLEARQLRDNSENRTVTEYGEDLDALSRPGPDADFLTTTAAQLGIDDPAASGAHLLFTTPHPN